MILRALHKTLRKLPRQAASVCLVAFVVATVGAAHAQVAVTPAITTAAGISTFDYTIDNATANDLAIVSISVPAIPGAVFDLMTPAGFLASFDSGTGFVDFLADSSSFGAGSSLSGFKFSSAFRPGAARRCFREERPMNLPRLFCFSVLPLLAGSLPAFASSHSDAPLIKLDPQANLTDVYAFIRQRPEGQKVLVVEVSVHPFIEAGDGVSYDAFADDALYSIHIANPVTGAEVQRYDFRFSPVSTNGNYKNLNTVLRYGRGTEIGPINNVGDARQNFVQTYTVTRTAGGVSSVLNGGMSLMVPPINVGLRTTPFYNDPVTGKAVSGATTNAGLDKYTRQTTYGLPNGYFVFAGTREDGFYSDIPGIFDLLDPRILGSTLGQGGDGVDGFKGFNVLHYAIEIPVSSPPSFAYSAPFPSRTSNGVGVYASVSRPRITLRRSDNNLNVSSGPWIQVNRLANPLFNEGLVALADKDNYNRTLPTGDAAYAKYALNPELAVLINATFGTSFQTTGRTDLAAIYIPDVIRVDTTTGPTHVAGGTGFSRLSFIGGDTINTSGGTAIPGGWPNGRRFGDDPVDIALTAIASGPSYTTVTVVGDNVAANDQAYNQVFPYAGTPHSGTRNSKDSGVNKEP